MNDPNMPGSRRKGRFENQAIAFFFVFTLAILLSVNGFSQNAKTTPDTLNLSLPDADRKFLESNYYLLAQKFNINIAEAAVEQAKLWNNPNFFFESVALNPESGKYFDYSNNTPQTAEYNFQIQQVVNLAATRSKLVKLSLTNTLLQKYAFYDLMRTLRFQLHCAFANLESVFAKKTLLEQDAERLGTLVTIQQGQFKAGAISGYELTRLQAEKQSLLIAVNDLNNSLSDYNAQVKLLIGLTGNIMVKPISGPIDGRPVPAIGALLDSALATRPDYLASKTQQIYQEQNLAYQNALAIPQVTFGLNFDKYGNAFTNYTALNAAFNLPFFNRNQGNIKAAKIGIDAAKANIAYMENVVRTEVNTAWQKYISASEMLATQTSEFQQQVQGIADAATADYNKRLIGLVDFIDRIRTYKTARLNGIDIRNNYIQAAENLNYTTNTSSVKP